MFARCTAKPNTLLIPSTSQLVRITEAIFQAAGGKAEIHCKPEVLRTAVSAVSHIETRQASTNFGWNADKTAYMVPGGQITANGFQVDGCDAIQVDLSDQEFAKRLNLQPIPAEQLAAAKRHIVDAIDYIVEGPRTAASVAAGRSRLIGLILREADHEPRFVDRDLAGLLDRLGDRQRIYPNSLFSLAIEARNDLPPPGSFHDFHALCCLLYGRDPFEGQPAQSRDRATLVQWSLERGIPFASYAQFLNGAIEQQLYPVYERIELPVLASTLAMTLTGVPFNTDTLDRLANRDSRAAALLRHVQPDGRIYADLDPLGAVTGRYSCKDPNLQGLPPAILAAVEATPGHVLLEADISQCELRVLAHFSQDPRLLAAYTARGNVDLHVQTAAAALGIDGPHVTDEQRGIGKQVNFAIVYGMTAESLAQKLAVSSSDAQALLDGYFTAYPAVRSWIARVHAAAHADRQVGTLSGRRRRLPDIRSRDPGINLALSLDPVPNPPARMVCFVEFLPDRTLAPLFQNQLMKREFICCAATSRTTAASGRGDPPTMRHPAHRPSGHPAGASETQPPCDPSNGRSVVKTFGIRSLLRKDLRRQLAKLG